MYCIRKQLTIVIDCLFAPLDLDYITIWSPSHVIGKSQDFGHKAGEVNQLPTKGIGYPNSLSIRRHQHRVALYLWNMSPSSGPQRTPSTVTRQVGAQAVDPSHQHSGLSFFPLACGIRKRMQKSR